MASALVRPGRVGAVMLATSVVLQLKGNKKVKLKPIWYYSSNSLYCSIQYFRICVPKRMLSEGKVKRRIIWAAFAIVGGGGMGAVLLSLRRCKFSLVVA